MARRPETAFTPIRLIEDQPIDDLDRDHLGLMPWAKMIAGAVVGTPGPFTIGVHGEWGYGKTTLLKLAKRLIEKHQRDVVTVWFNAWQFEREEHPLFPLVAAIVKGIESKTTGAKALKGLKDLGQALHAVMCGTKFHAEIGLPGVAKVAAELDPGEASEAAERLANGADPLRHEMLYHLAFDRLQRVARGRVKIAVFVDDVDRCRPDKAVFLLEGIKLILAQPGFVFVLAVDRRVIENYLAKRYADYCGEGQEDMGRFYMDKIVQLPIQIPSHRTRFEHYVERVIAELSEHHRKNSKPINALRVVSRVLAAGAGTNPRSLVRLVNNFLLDCTLWPLIDRRGDPILRKYQRLSDAVAAALAFSRILQSELGELYPTLIGDQDLCNAILAGQTKVEKYAAEAGPPDEPPEEGGARPSARFRPPRVPSPVSRRQVARELLDRPELLDALREHGQDWLRDENLRRAVYEFAQKERAEAAPVEFPEPIAAAIRDALGLKRAEPIPADRLAEVVRLDLSWSAVTDPRLEHLKGLTGLQELSLGGTKVTDAGLEHLKGLTGLSGLDLSGTQVPDAGLVHLKGLSGLDWLSLWGTEVTDAGLVHLKGLTGLRRLHLGETKITDAGLGHLEGLTGLQELYLGHIAVTDAGLQHLKGLTGLRRLNLSGTWVTDAALGHLTGLSRLRELDLWGTAVTDAGLDYLKGLARLRRLNLSGTRVTDAGLQHLRGLSRLQQLDLADTRVTDAGLEHVEGLSGLQRLDLADTQVTDAGLEHLKGLSGLRELHLLGAQVTDAGIEHLKGLSGLRELHLAYTDVTDAGLEHLKGLSRLQWLDLEGTKVTRAGAQALRQVLPGAGVSL